MDPKDPGATPGSTPGEPGKGEGEGKPTEGQQPPPEPAPTEQKTEGEEKDPEKLLELVRKLRPFEKEAGQLRKELDGVKVELKTRQDAELSDKEKLEKRVAELEAEKTVFERERQELRTRGVAEAAAAKAGALYPDVVWSRLDLSKVEYDDDGKPTNLEPLIEEMRTTYPALFSGAGSGDGGPRGTPSEEKKDMETLLRAAATGKD